MNIFLTYYKLLIIYTYYQFNIFVCKYCTIYLFSEPNSHLRDEQWNIVQYSVIRYAAHGVVPRRGVNSKS